MCKGTADARLVSTSATQQKQSTAKEDLQYTCLKNNFIKYTRLRKNPTAIAFRVIFHDKKNKAWVRTGKIMPTCHLHGIPNNIAYFKRVDIYRGIYSSIIYVHVYTGYENCQPRRRNITNHSLAGGTAEPAALFAFSILIFLLFDAVARSAKTWHRSSADSFCCPRFKT